MNYSYKIAILFTFLTITNVNSQQKLKGNKEVKTEDRNISDFNRIEVIDDVDVELVYNEFQSVRVEADSNLQNSILTEVINGTLSIKLNDKIIRKKALTIHIDVNKSIKDISVYNNANIKSNNSLSIDTLVVNAFDNADISLKLNSKLLHINSKKTSDLKLEILTNEINIRGEETSDIKAILDSKLTVINLIDKSSLNLTGSTSWTNIDTSGNSSFKGKNFTSKEIDLNATNSSNVWVNAKESIDVRAKNSSQVYIYANPKITLLEFFDKATLYKKEL